jgi:hypothetical protein
MERIIIYTILAILLFLLGSIAWLDLSLHQDELRWIEEQNKVKMNNMKIDYWLRKIGDVSEIR